MFELMLSNPDAIADKFASVIRFMMVPHCNVSTCGLACGVVVVTDIGKLC
jgi:hypothetical protein